MVYVLGSQKDIHLLKIVFWSCLVVSIVLMGVTMRFYGVTRFLDSSHLPAAAPPSPRQKTVLTQDSREDAIVIPPKSAKCPSTIVFARTSPFGGFGNHCIEYLSAWAVALRHNYTPVVSDAIADALSTVFRGLTVPSSKGFLRSVGPRCYEKTKRLLRTEPSVNSSGEVQKLLNRKQAIALRPSIQLVDEIVAMRPKIKEELQILPQLQLYAQRKLHQLRGSFRASRRRESQIMYVGIHVRRKDYHRYLRGKFGMKNRDMADKRYYQRALDFVLHGLPRAVQGVVLVVVGDEKPWCEDTLIPHLQRHLVTRNQSDHVTVTWGGSEDFHKDFTVLSSCNHSIVAYGTFAICSSLLAGGRTVVYDVDKGSKITGAMHFARNIPNWTIMK